MTSRDPYGGIPIPSVEVPRRLAPRRRRRARRPVPLWVWLYLALAAGSLAWLLG